MGVDFCREKGRGLVGDGTFPVLKRVKKDSGKQTDVLLTGGVMKKSGVSDKDVVRYMNSFYMDMFVKECEQNLLKALKMRQENFPSEKNDRAWLEFSQYVLGRRPKKSRARKKELANG